jgi:hypothetical protein
MIVVNGIILEITVSGYNGYTWVMIPLYVVPDVGEPRMVQANPGTQSFLVLKFRIPNGSKWKKYLVV